MNKLIQCREDMRTALGFKPHDEDRYWTLKQVLKKGIAEYCRFVLLFPNSKFKEIFRERYTVKIYVKWH